MGFGISLRKRPLDQLAEALPRHTRQLLRKLIWHGFQNRRHVIR